MKLVVQRVSSASVKVDGKIVGEIGKGFLILLGIGHQDTEEDVEWAVKKVAELRIFQDENDKMNLSLMEVGGSILVISQFTLYGDASKGRRPSFIEAAKPEIATPLYEKFILKAKEAGINTQSGIFGAKMLVSLINEGPVTIIL